MIHTSITMYFNQSRVTSNIYWTELDTTNPTTTLALNHNANIYNNHNSGFIQSLPNVSSWRGMVVSNIFDKVLDMKTNPIYGWSPTDTKIDTHMMKIRNGSSSLFIAVNIWNK